MWFAGGVLLCGVLAVTQARGEGWVVRTAQGAVRGYPSELGDFFAFYGIPYATAPTGNDKFKEPLPPPAWSNILEATNDKIICPQLSVAYLSTNNKVQQEDCLVVNIFVPKSLQQGKKLSVMVYVHGGGFAVGYGNSVTHELLLRHGVIVINFNYRLGAYGFLCLGTKDIPGNAGLKDQVTALRWIKQNIANFGGKPDDVTIGGYSAGSASVELLMLSSMARGLFNKAISESGSALSTWALDPDPVAMAQRFVKDISDKEFDDVMDLDDFFKSLTTEELTSKIYFSEPSSHFGFSPCVERHIESTESFLNESPLEILKNGSYNKVPYITGLTSEEGLFRIDQFDEWREKMEETFSYFLPRDLVFENEDTKILMAEEVKEFYFRDESISIDTILKFVDYFTDTAFGYSIVRSARLHAANTVPVFLYQYSYVPKHYPHGPHQYSDKIKGAFHCAQSHSVHNFHTMKSKNASENCVLMEDRLTKMWTDFSKFGTPMNSTSALLPVTWDTVDIYRINYLSMNVELQMKERLLGDRVRFWDSIYAKYYRTPLRPPTSHSHNEL